MSMGAKIQMLREREKVRQCELAKMVGVTPQMMSFIEQGTRIPSVAIITRIADIFGVSIDWLVGRKKKKPEQTE